MQHGKAIGWFLSMATAIAGTVMDTAEHHLGMLAILFSVLLSAFLICNAVLELRHKLFQERQDRKADKIDADAEKKRLENLICEERQRTGVCPKSTFKTDHDA